MQMHNKEGNVITADPDQVELMKKAGYKVGIPEKKAAPAKPAESNNKGSGNK